MRKFGVVVVKPRNKGKGLPSYATRTRRIKIQAIQQRRVNKKTILGDVVKSFGNINSWEEVHGKRKQCKNDVKV